MSDLVKDLREAVEAFKAAGAMPYRDKPRWKGAMAYRLVSNHGAELLKLVDEHEALAAKLKTHELVPRELLQKVHDDSCAALDELAAVLGIE